MIDAHLRQRIRDGTVTSRDLARVGLVALLQWDGHGFGDGNGNGFGFGDGDGDGDGFGFGNGNRNGNGDGDGNGDGEGFGNGNGDGDGFGNGNGDGDPPRGDQQVKHTDYIQIGTPVVVRSYVSGVFVGRLAGGEAGTVLITDWRWLRRWEGVGREGSVYDLIHSDKAPTRWGPRIADMHMLQQADAIVVSEECYTRLIDVEPADTKRRK